MKKLFAVISSIILTFTGFSQNIYTATSGEIKFFSEAPVENIEAHNSQVKSIINFDNKELAFIVPIIGFKFEKELMEEHFNENYMESDKYKTAQFKGSFDGDLDLKKDGTYPVIAKGTLNIHGVDQEREFSGEMTVKGNSVNLKCEFPVKLKDHKIDTPKMVIKNIAEEVNVKVNTNFEPKTSK